DPPWRPATLSYKGEDGNPVNVPIQARTRGIWRLKRCDFPPMRLNFGGETSKGSIFHHLDKPKLVSYCQDRDMYEAYILEEFQLYRVLQVLTPMSHKARLLKFTYADSGSGKIRAKRYGFNFAGVVNATYAVPDERLGIPTVRQRLYRGYCIELEQWAKVFDLFKAKKSEIYALYSDSIGKLMDPGTVRSTLKYYDEFYE